MTDDRSAEQSAAMRELAQRQTGYGSWFNEDDARDCACAADLIESQARRIADIASIANDTAYAAEDRIASIRMMLDAPASPPAASPACPICGVGTPHPHGPNDICTWLKKQAGRFNLNVEVFDRTEHKDHIEYLASVRHHFHEFVKSMGTGKSINYAWQLWCESPDGKDRLNKLPPEGRSKFHLFDVVEWKQNPGHRLKVMAHSYTCEYLAGSSSHTFPESELRFVETPLGALVGKSAETADARWPDETPASLVAKEPT